MNGWRVLDLFSGIGGFSLGLERAGMRTVAFCEIEPYCRAVLRKHWPNVPIYHDVRELTGAQLSADGIVPNIICGGFPCQDVSIAGNRLGLVGERSGLWSHQLRLVREIRPRVVIVENTPGLLSLGMGRVLGDLAELRYDAEWENIPAAFVGADHLRERIWIVAYPDHLRKLQPPGRKQNERRRACNGFAEILTDAVRTGLQEWINAGTNGGEAADVGTRSGFTDTPSADAPGFDGSYQPLLGREVHGLPSRVDRVEALGNAVVPQIPELIGKAIIAAERERVT